MARPVDVIVRRDGDSWSAWSPQCKGLAIVQPTAADLRDALPGILEEFAGAGEDLDVRVHVEEEVRGAVVRVAQDEHVWERQHTAARVVAALGDPRQHSLMLSVRRNSLGDVVFVCAMPGDTVGWVIRQLDDDGDRVHVVVPVADNLIWADEFGCESDGRAEKTTDGLGFSEDSTLAEVMQSDDSPRHMKV